LLDRHAQPELLSLFPRDGGRADDLLPCLAWLRRYLAEKEPTLKNFAKLVRELEERQVQR